MKVGLYVDAFNLYYGGKDHCGRGVAGWRWLDLASLATSLIDVKFWPDASLSRIVYCTAHRDRAGDPTSIVDQQTYIAALLAGSTPTEAVYGHYVPRMKSGHLVNRKGRRIPSPGASSIPAWLKVEEVRGPEGTPVLRGAVTTFEEKGSDVNVASHLLLDVLTDQVEAAIVISNDSDLEVPLREARKRIPIGTVNPGVKATTDALKGESTGGAGHHWWRRLQPADFTDHQLQDPVGGLSRPIGW